MRTGVTRSLLISSTRQADPNPDINWSHSQIQKIFFEENTPKEFIKKELSKISSQLKAGE